MEKSSVEPLNPEWDIKHLRIATDAAGVALWSWNVDTDEINMDDRGFDLWGEARRDKITFADLSSHIHPADRDRVAVAFNATRAHFGAYELDFRINVIDEIRWVAARGKGDDEGHDARFGGPRTGDERAQIWLTLGCWRDAGPFMSHRWPRPCHHLDGDGRTAGCCSRVEKWVRK